MSSLSQRFYRDWITKVLMGLRLKSNFTSTRHRKSKKGTLSFEDKVKIAKLKNDEPNLSNKEIVERVLEGRTDIPEGYFKNPGSVVYGVKASLEKIVETKSPIEKYNVLKEAGLIEEDPRYR